MHDKDMSYLDTRHQPIRLQYLLQLLYSLDQTPRLLFNSAPNFVRHLFESGDYSRAAFISLSKRPQASPTFNITFKTWEWPAIHCRRVEWLPMPGRQSAQKRPHSLTSTLQTRRRKLIPSLTLENELEENELVLDDC